MLVAETARAKLTWADESVLLGGPVGFLQPAA
jgi:hypothetical protein